MEVLVFLVVQEVNTLAEKVKYVAQVEVEVPFLVAGVG